MKRNGFQSFLAALIIATLLFPLSLAADYSTGDPNCSGATDIDDIVYLIAYVFQGGPEPCTPSEFGGAITGNTGCKYLKGAAWTDTTSDRDCIEWDYDGQSTLTVHHINAGLNCCPVIAAEFSIVGDLITIEELDSLEGGGCDCNCLFNIDYELNGVEPGVYTFKVIEPYRHTSDPELIFEINLTTESSGIECVPRSYYPWGY